MVAAFHRPETVAEALRLLSSEDARPISGGATLVAMMNASLAEPSTLVSLARIAELRSFSRLPDGTVRIGAMRRHRETAEESDLHDGQQIVALAARQIANATVRNMGTIGGSIAFADPAADYPPALVAADARIEIASEVGKREVAASEFFTGWYETALQPGEIVPAVLLPAAPAGSIGHYEKLARVSGDFAIASVAAVLQLAGRRASYVRLAIGGCGPAPVRAEAAEALLLHEGLTQASVRQASDLIVSQLDPLDDTRASADYRRKVVPRLIAKTLTALVQKAAEKQ